MVEDPAAQAGTQLAQQVQAVEQPASGAEVELQPRVGVLLSTMVVAPCQHARDSTLEAEALFQELLSSWLPGSGLASCTAASTVEALDIAIAASPRTAKRGFNMEGIAGSAQTGNAL